MPVYRTGRFAFRSVLAAGGLLLTGIAAGCSGLPQTEPEMRQSDATSKAAQALHMAKTVRDAGDLSTAILFYRRAQSLLPDDPAPWIGLAQTAIQLGSREEAVEAYEKALALAPATPETHLEYAKLLVSLDRPELAAAQFAELVKLSPDDHRVFNGLGAALDLSGRHVEAQQTYTDGLLLAPNNPGLRNNLALSLALSGDFAEAERMLTELTTDPQLGPRARENLALVNGLAGDWEAAAQTMSGLGTEEQQRAKLDTYRAATRLSGRELAAVVFGVRQPPAVTARATVPSEAPPSKNDDTAFTPSLTFAGAGDPILAVGGEAKMVVEAEQTAQAPVKRRRARPTQPADATLALSANADPVPGHVGPLTTPRFVLPSGLTATADPVPGKVGSLRAPRPAIPASQTAADPVPGSVGAESSQPAELASPAAPLPATAPTLQNPETPATAALLAAHTVQPGAKAATHANPTATIAAADADTSTGVATGNPASVLSPNPTPATH